MGSWERWRSTGMAVNHTLLLTYGGDKSLQSIKKKNLNNIKNISLYYVSIIKYI